jgi:hypothetical protein
MIVPISISSTDGYYSLRKVCKQSGSGYYFSNFGVRPSKLFEGVDKRLTIMISSSKNNSTIYSTKYYRWVSNERNSLFEKLFYKEVKPDMFSISGYPKISSNNEANILQTLSKKKTCISNFVVRNSQYKVKYTRKLQYFIQFFEDPPIIYNSKREILIPSELKEINFQNADQKYKALAVLNSNLFFWFFISFSDCRNVNAREINRFPINLDEINFKTTEKLTQLSIELLRNLKLNSIFQYRNDKRAGQIEIESFQPRLSKQIVDQIDLVLSDYYGFKSEELDFIINYDIKYRMGNEMENDEDED